ncbi:lactonase family protein [Coraliomargarita akajimensis]|uniref:6-phosphogluconolactonase n=1 Tax=Coraliomargarita akajimensis (strain DSM 45221 / IAM 15411 / JCM 23193 / KCTC 12865 / 04OKA010-24) TaxID=583355 RepID=D5ER46_CORAD|nr:lactonase family protein [Coraliomargarita akajimensis]ADE55890.1 6-phosphogluconolactonase [Coraliomargarita akajimensis DSM 45221]
MKLLVNLTQLLSACVLFGFSLNLSAQNQIVYLGTGGGLGEGIYRADFDSNKGELSELELAAEVDAPGFLALHPEGHTLYAVANGEGRKGLVVAYRIENDGSLERLNEAVIEDGRAAHISVHPSGEFLLTAQYGGGSVAVFPLDPSGSVLTCLQTIKHRGGSGVVERRQARPHPHWVGYSPDGRFAFVPDLGMDQIVVYRVNFDKLKLEAHTAFDSQPGGGPRHMRFSGDGRFIYLLNELSLSVRTFAYDARYGRAHFMSDTEALEASVKEQELFNSASEILVHPNNRFVYSANRGHDSVTVYHSDSDSGRLEVLEVEPIRGSWPRNIALDPSGEWLLAAGARSNTITVFHIDSETGLLQFNVGPVFNAPNVICMVFRDDTPSKSAATSVTALHERY